MTTLQARFDAHPHRHNTLRWEEVQAALDEEKLAGIRIMEETGGEPDAIEYEGHIYYADFSEESPIARRNLAYDEEGEKERHKDKYRPAGNAHTMAKSMGAEIVDRAFYEYMQGIEDLDLKTSSWLKPPPSFGKWAAPSSATSDMASAFATTIPPRAFTHPAASVRGS